MRNFLMPLHPLEVFNFDLVLFNFSFDIKTENNYQYKKSKQKEG